MIVSIIVTAFQVYSANLVKSNQSITAEAQNDVYNEFYDNQINSFKSRLQQLFINRKPNDNTGIIEFLKDLYATDKTDFFSKQRKSIEEVLLSGMTEFDVDGDLNDFTSILLTDPKELGITPSEISTLKTLNQKTINKINTAMNKKFREFSKAAEIQNSRRDIQTDKVSTPSPTKTIEKPSDQTKQLSPEEKLLKAYVNSMSDIPSNYEAKKLYGAGNDFSMIKFLDARNDAVTNFFKGSKGNYEFDDTKKFSINEIKTALEKLKGFTPEMRKRQLESTLFGNNASKQNALSQFEAEFNKYYNSTTSSLDKSANREQIDTILSAQSREQYQTRQELNDQATRDLVNQQQRQERDQRVQDLIRRDEFSR